MKYRNDNSYGSNDIPERAQRRSKHTPRRFLRPQTPHAARCPAAIGKPLPSEFRRLLPYRHLPRMLRRQLTARRQSRKSRLRPHTSPTTPTPHPNTLCTALRRLPMPRPLESPSPQAAEVQQRGARAKCHTKYAMAKPTRILRRDFERKVSASANFFVNLRRFAPFSPLVHLAKRRSHAPNAPKTKQQQTKQK